MKSGRVKKWKGKKEGKVCLKKKKKGKHCKLERKGKKWQNKMERHTDCNWERERVKVSHNRNGVSYLGGRCCNELVKIGYF